MKKILFIALILIAQYCFAQQGLYTDFTEQDSAQMILQRQIEYYQLITGNYINSDLLLGDLELPEYDFMDEIQKSYTVGFDFSPVNNYIGISNGMTSPLYSPYYRNGEVLSAAAYKLGNKLTLGGFSYGANSVFSAPYPSQGMNNNFDSYGSTLFMQYKVSKKFKIETRINVQQNGRHPGF